LADLGSIAVPLSPAAITSSPEPASAATLP
jgi:hypothetical protein